MVSKIGIKMNFRIVIAKNFAAAPEKEFLTKTILKPYGRTAAIATALKSKTIQFLILAIHKI